MKVIHTYKVSTYKTRFIKDSFYLRLLLLKPDKVPSNVKWRFRENFTKVFRKIIHKNITLNSTLSREHHWTEDVIRQMSILEL